MTGKFLKRTILLVAWCLGGSVGTIAGEGASFAQAPAVTKRGDGAMVSFAMAAKVDVEVAVLNAKGEPIRVGAGVAPGGGLLTVGGPWAF